MGFEPSYINLLQNDTLLDKVNQAKEHYRYCNLCPHECGVDRTKNRGFCQAADKVIVSSFGPHFGEESVLVGKNGSGTIFFGYCNMRCVFCQNFELSFGGVGTAISNEELSEIMLSIQNYYECHNINLVSPTHFVPNIIEAVYLASQKGLYLPLVYNCGGYEKIETLKLLDQVIDIYMPDFKYSSAERGKKYSQVADYPNKVKLALKEMDSQVGGLRVDEKGLAYRGLLIRHLVLPGGLEDTKAVLRFINEELSPDCLVNLMSQYYPSNRAFEYPEIAKRLSVSEYREAENLAQKLGLRLRGFGHGGR
ncbi:MAG: radical SAM protein [Clostridiaceae bacterium]|nr:radical SAM protein [Clostridiaceae bacterium]